MKYIRFDNTKLPNLEFSLPKEILQTNRAGAYLSTSITGCNTRKYHGMLVCPLEQFGGESYVMLSSLQCTVVQHERSFNLGLQQYKGDFFEPKGHKYLCDYSAEPVTKITHRVGGVVLSQEFCLATNENQVMIRYTLEDAHSDTLLRLKPFLAYRNIHQLTHENMAVNTHYETAPNGASFRMYEGFPNVFVQGSKEMEYVAMPDWYRDVQYMKESFRGYDYLEDLYVPGYFEFPIKKGESVVVSVSLSEAAPGGLKTKFTRELKNRSPKDSMLNMLLNAAQQFVERRKDGVMLKAGYHWKTPQMRDMFVALPGLALWQTDKKVYTEIFETALPNLRRLYIEQTANNSTSIDVPLWFFYCINEIERWVPSLTNVNSHYALMRDLLNLYWNGVPGKMFRTDNNLIYARAEGQPQTWMNAKTQSGELITPRYGMAVEVNALWYNAIATTLQVARALNDTAFTSEWEPRLEQVGKAFLETFCNPEGYLYDYVDGNHRSGSVRGNMIIAAGLKYTPLSREQKKGIFDVCKRDLLTVRGLRSLSPRDEKYTGAIEGNESQRAYALHQGSIYPWLLGFYADVAISVHRGGYGVAQIRNIVNAFEPELGEHCVGSISERYNGNPPFDGHGAISMAWNVAALLKLLKIVEE